MAGRLRWTELSLLILPALFLGLGMTMLALARPEVVSTSEVRVSGAVLVLLLAAHFVLSWRLPRSDQLVLPLVAMLSLIGLLMANRLSSLDSGLMTRQGIWVAVGLVLMLVVVLLPLDVAILESYKYTAAVLGVLLVATTFVFGTDPNNSGVRAWLGFRGYYFQPSEILKVLLVIFLAGYLEDKRELLAWSSSRFG